MNLTGDDTTIPIPCTKCGRKTSKTLGWLQKNNSFICPGCNAEVRFRHDQFLQVVSDAEKALAGLRRTMTKTGAAPRSGTQGNRAQGNGRRR